MTREPDPGDGRGVRVRLTDAGRTAVDHVAGEVLRHDDDLVSTLTDDDLQRLETELRELIGSVERRQADLHDQAGT